MKRSRLRLLSIATLGAALSGCAAQIGAGLASNGGAASGTLSIEGRTFVPRESGPLLGASVNAALVDRGAPLRVRSGMVSAGYHARTADGFPQGFGGEAAIDLGLGQPMAKDLSGTGGYVGASGTLLYRLHGPGDDEPRFDILSALVDLAITPRAGVWTSPEGSSGGVVPELGAQLALRLTFTSDLGSSSEPGKK
jgi:hypothetical protein